MIANYNLRGNRKKETSSFQRELAFCGVVAEKADDDCHRLLSLVVYPEHSGINTIDSRDAARNIRSPAETMVQLF